MSTLQTTFLKHPDAAGNQITFTSGGDVNFDNGAVYLDSTNNRLGVGTTSPAENLHINEASTNTATLRISNDDGYHEFKVNNGNLTLADGTSDRLRIDSSGRLLVGTTSTTGYKVAIRVPNTTETSGSFLIENSSAIGSIYFFNVSGTGVNTSGSAMWIEKNTSTNRSINAGGTVNASGADYAEYMTKAGNFTIAKGDICGITADGLLTLKYNNAVSFVVKSTNPSYVGGDTWGSEDVIGSKPDEDDALALAQWEADLEAARQLVDRIAFAGQVPVNVSGATPGQYIVPIESTDGGIIGIAKNETDLTLADYIRSVGKVIATENDGRARIIVKVA